MRALLVLIALSGTALADEKVAVRAQTQGIALYKKGDYQAALQRFITARELFPEKPNPHRWLVLTFARLGRCDEATTELEKFISMVPPRDPRVVEARQERDRCTAQTNATTTTPPSPPTETPASATPPNANAAKPPERSVVLDAAEQEMVAGERAYDAGDYHKAAYHFGRAQYLAPEKPGPHYWLGMAQAGAGLCVESIATLQRYLTLKGSDPRPEAQKTIDECRQRTGFVVKPGKKKRPLWAIGLVVGLLAAGGVAAGISIGVIRSQPTVLPEPVVGMAF